MLDIGSRSNLPGDEMDAEQTAQNTVGRSTRAETLDVGGDNSIVTGKSTPSKSSTRVLRLPKAPPKVGL